MIFMLEQIRVQVMHSIVDNKSKMDQYLESKENEEVLGTFVEE